MRDEKEKFSPQRGIKLLRGTSGAGALHSTAVVTRHFAKDIKDMGIRSALVPL